MGRAIVRDPSVFLFDEPLSNLDAKLRVQMRGEIKSLHQRLETTTVYVTHDQIEAMTMADQIVVMNQGKVEQIGAPLELYDRPANLFVAGFIGSPAMNFIAGTVRKDGFLTADGLLLPLDARVASHIGNAAVYGIRPEHLVLDRAGLPFAVELIEPTGSETQVQGKLGEQPIFGCVSRADRHEARVRRSMCRLKPARFTSSTPVRAGGSIRQAPRGKKGVRSPWSLSPAAQRCASQTSSTAQRLSSRTTRRPSATPASTSSGRLMMRANAPPAAAAIAE